MATHDYLTELGRLGTGHTLNRHPSQAAELVHDILLRAANEKLDVSILCGALSKPLRDDFYEDVCGRRYDELLQAVLEVGCNVRILIWNEDIPGIISNRLRELMEKAASGQELSSGKFDVRISRTREHVESVSHFIVAARKSENKWILRLEEPHPHFPVDQPITRVAPQRPAAIIFGHEATEIGPVLLETFEKLFAAAGPSKCC